MKRLVHIDRFERGLVTQVDSGDLPEESATRLDNILVDRPGKLRGLPMYKSFCTGPSGLTMQHFEEVVINDTQILICWGVDGSDIQHFYYSADGGSNWIEITEIVFTEVDVVTDADTFTLTAGSSPFNTTLSTTDNYYQKWQVYWHDVSTPANDTFDYVESYVGGSNTLETLYGFTGIASGDKIVLMRFPFWNLADLQDLADGTISDFDDYRNVVRDQSNFKPTIIQRENSVAVYTGRSNSNLSTKDPISGFGNFWFGYIDRGNWFDDSNLAYTGYHAENKYLYRPYALATPEEVSTPQDPVPDGKFWIAAYSLIYDDYQESDIWYDLNHLFVGYTSFGLTLDLSAKSDDSLEFQFSWEKFTPYDASAFETESRTGMSRRITAIRIYLAQGEKVETGNPTYKPITPFLFVKEISLTEDSTWAGTGPYTYAKAENRVNGADWDAGHRKEAEIVHGYFSRTRVQADLATVVRGREVVASIWAGAHSDIGYNTEGDAISIANPIVKSVSSLIYTPINLAKKNVPDSPPESDIRNMSEDGIYEIKSIKPLGDLLAVFGVNKIALLSDTDTIRTFEEKGVQGYWSVFSRGDKLYFGNNYSLYELNTAGQLNEIGFPVRNEWQDETAVATSKAAYDSEEERFLIYADDMFIYDTALRAWSKYVSALTWNWITTGVDGEVLATDGTTIYELFPSSGSTESLTGTYEKEFDFEGNSIVKMISLGYRLPSGLITVSIYDKEKGTNYKIAEQKFFPKSNFDSEVKKLSFKAKKIRLQIQVSGTTNPDWEIDWYTLFGHSIEASG